MGVRRGACKQTRPATMKRGALGRLRCAGGGLSGAAQARRINSGDVLHVWFGWGRRGAVQERSRVGGGKGTSPQKNLWHTIEALRPDGAALQVRVPAAMCGWAAAACLGPGGAGATAAAGRTTGWASFVATVAHAGCGRGGKKDVGAWAHSRASRCWCCRCIAWVAWG